MGSTVGRVAVAPAGSEKIELIEVALPAPGPHEVVVRQLATGVCHTQLHQMSRPDRTAPAVLGHEAVSEVVAVGGDVSHVGVGDTVVVTWLPRNSRRRPAAAALDIPGLGAAQVFAVYTWSEYSILDEQYVVPVPAGARDDELAIVGCAVMTGTGAVVRTAGVPAGASVAVIGAGGIGLCAIAGARLAGADPVIAVDITEEKLRLARRAGATVTVNAALEDPVAAVHAHTRGAVGPGGDLDVEGADYVFECIGLEATSQQALACTRTGVFGVAEGGMLVLLGIAQPSKQIVDIQTLMAHQRRIATSIGGSCQPDRDFPQFLEWHERGDLRLDAIVTHRYPLEGVNDAVADLEAGRITGRALLVP